MSREINKAIKQHAGDLSAEQIGELVGISGKAVHHRAQAIGISLRRYGEKHWRARVPDIYVQAAQALYDAGFKPEQIVTVVPALEEVSRSTLWAWLDGRNRQEAV